ncbi:WD40-repeat-containing domain protein [Catenaria anguillulae PL171]|uniref:WD40-repeat-containing domain protein n=1 Tax=Catenaria anguillulae PL171 TaxID=765915 RepID=A0A1Y2HLB7_9FUNG|nr:WD40-repeat-containing domain protein [Catenaria anguillulae PL171]
MSSSSSAALVAVPHNQQNQIAVAAAHPSTPRYLLPAQPHLWTVNNECKNWAVLQGHRSPPKLEWTQIRLALSLLQLIIRSPYTIAASGLRVRQFKAHSGIVSQVATTSRSSGTLVLSGGDDGNVLVWDTRQKQPVDRLSTNLPVCALAADLSSGELLFTGSVDNGITAWDIRTKKYCGGLKLSPDRTSLLSVSMDATARFGRQPFSAVAGRMLSVLPGLVSDQTQAILYKLPGHRGPVIASCALDGSVYLGEIQLIFIFHS